MSCIFFAFAFFAYLMKRRVIVFFSIFGATYDDITSFAMKRLILSLLFACEIVSHLFGSPNMIVEHYTVEQGLANNIVNCALKGEGGFMWFGTWYGLCSFDGTKFKAYNNRDGLYSDLPPRKIESLLEDKNGFLWMKTVDRKLYIFDKVNERFHPVYDDMKLYSGNIQIIKLQKTADGDMLLLTKDKSLLRASTDATGKVNIQLLHDSGVNASLYDWRLRNNVFSETKEYLNWIGKDYKIFSYRKSPFLISKPADFISKEIGGGSDKVFTCVCGDTKNVWLADDGGAVYQVDLSSGRVNRHQFQGLEGEIENLLVTNSGILYLAIANRGIYEYHLKSGLLRKLSLSLFNVPISHAFIDKMGKVWWQSGNEGLLYYDPQTDESERFLFPTGHAIGSFDVQDAGEQGLFFLTPAGEVLFFDQDSHAMVRLNSLKQFAIDGDDKHLFLGQYIDKDGIFWLLSATAGVYKVNFPKKQFKLLDLHQFDTSLSHTNGSTDGIKALFQARNGDIWVGTRWEKVYRFDKSGKLKQIFSKANYQIGRVYHIMEDNKGNLWFSTKGSGLVKAIPDNSSPLGFQFIRYTSDSHRSNSISGNEVYFTFQDTKERIWVGVLAGGLNLISEENGKTVFKHKYNGLKHYPSYGLYMDVRNMVEDNNGRIWVGTMDGLMSFDSHFTAPDKIVFETYRSESASSNIADNDIYVLYKDKDANIWVSVFGGGVNKLIGYDKIKHRPLFKAYGMKEGLNNDVVVSIVEDNHKNLWFATEGGISRFNKKTERIRNFDKYDGFLNVKMEENSALKALNGDLWLGCKQGILIFSPDKLETLNANYRTCIVDFMVSNKNIRSFKEHPILMKSVKYADSIRLKHNQSMFTIEFAALNYYNQNRVSYRYILEGYESEWHSNGKNRIASYTNVPPGDYVFKVQSIDEANPDLLSEKKLVITILSPWWLTWWAYCIYGVLGLILLYGILKIIFVMMKMKNEVYIEQRLSELKIKFFTNISHELRTPLTLIKGPIQELKEKEALSSKGVQYVELMEKNTNQMLQLVNQILDFRKIQNGKMRLHVSRINMNKLLDTLQKEFKVLSEESDIYFSFEFSNEIIYLWADKDKLNIVLRNIISNAFKFTPTGGRISVSMGLTEDEKRCYVRVEDTGVGIPQNKLSEIFERFSQGDNSPNAYYQGTGIGLALSKEIINLHHGFIVAESQEGQGAVFTIELFLGKEHYKTAEVDFYVSDSDSVEVQQQDEQEEIEDKEQPDASLPNLLVVEDNRDLGRLLKLQMEDKYNVYLAENGVEGLKKVHLYHPDIVVTDQMMPEMSGLELLQRIREDFQISHIPVIILTAKSDDVAKTRATNMGANAYITKPFSKDYLIARIEQLLGERKLFRERFWQQSEDKQPDSYEQFLVKKDVQLLDKIHQVIEQNLDNSDFNIDSIAASVGLSRSAFFKKLKSLTGLAPVDLVKEIRLNKSIELIKNSDMSISEIAFAVGFKDSGYYGKCFRKKYNQTPKEYMNEWRKT